MGDATAAGAERWATPRLLGLRCSALDGCGGVPAAPPSTGVGACPTVGFSALDGCGGVSAALPSTGAGACRLLLPRRVRGRVGCSALDGCGGVSAALPSTCEGAGPPGRLPRPRDRGLKRGGGGGVDWLLRARVRCAALDGDWPRHWRSSFQRRAN